MRAFDLSVKPSVEPKMVSRSVFIVKIYSVALKDTKPPILVASYYISVACRPMLSGKGVNL